MTRLDLDAKIAKLKARVDAETAEIVQTALAGALEKASLTPEIQEMILREFGSRLRQPTKAEMTVKALVETT
jgi:predicted  nucleic acid-binding Zn-ribbon protein